MREGGLSPILEGACSSNMDLKSQCARALRNLSVNRESNFPVFVLGVWWMQGTGLFGGFGVIV